MALFLKNNKYFKSKENKNNCKKHNKKSLKSKKDFASDFEQSNDIKNDEIVNNKNSDRIAKKHNNLHFVPPFSKVVFEVETDLYNALVNKLAHVAQLNDISCVCGKLLFSVPSKDRSKIIALLNDMCYNYSIIAVKGAFAYAFSLFQRVGIVIGTVICIMVAILYSYLVTSVDINTTDKEIQNVLDAYGIRQGALLFSLDESKVASDIMAMDNISFASVEKVGSHVRVCVHYALANESFVPETATVTAKVNSVVSRVIVFSGTAQVKVGDKVNVDDTLIGGYYVVGDTQIATTPSGEVYGTRTISKSMFFADTYISTEKADTTTYCRISMFGKMPDAPTSPYQNFELHYSAQKSDFLIGYIVHCWQYVEIVNIEKQNTLTENEMKDIVYSSLVEMIDEDIVARDDKIVRIDNGYTVTSTVTVEERIDK